MEGDFTRNSDDPEGTYSGVLMQQGRVQLDADWNEQAAIQTRALRAALHDLIGDHGGPIDGPLGFAVTLSQNGSALSVQKGVYYVDGIRCHQRTDLSLSLKDVPHTRLYLAFLDVWERHVNLIEDPKTREVALLGPDTASRSEVLWRVRLLDVGEQRGPMLPAEADRLVKGHLRDRRHRRLAARADTANPSDDPCPLPPSAQYRGRENQLYRVEIHDAGGEGILFTYKWSRDNGSVVFPIVHVDGPGTPRPSGDEIEVTVELAHLGREERYGLVAGDIVEFVHDQLTRGLLEPVTVVSGNPDPGRSGLLGRVIAIDRDAMTVRVVVFANDIAQITDKPEHAYLRRWDQRDTPERRLVAGAIPVNQDNLDTWLELEDGVEIRFESPSPNIDAKIEQRAGDYWQIPARVATGDVVWPAVADGDLSIADEDNKLHKLCAPHGPHHHYAPLALFTWTGSQATGLTPTRRHFRGLARPEGEPPL